MVELMRTTEVRQGHVQKHFGFYTRALNACNLQGSSGGNPLPLDKLFADWARVVRALKKIPSFSEYEQLEPIHENAAQEPVRALDAGAYGDEAPHAKNKS